MQFGVGGAVLADHSSCSAEYGTTDMRGMTLLTGMMEHNK